MSSEDEAEIEASLQTYEAQLTQVEAALEQVEDKSDLEALKGDLEQLIALTKDSLFNVKKAKLLQHVESLEQNEESKTGLSEETGLNEEESSNKLVGMKCFAPFNDVHSKAKAVVFDTVDEHNGNLTFYN